MDQYTNQVIGLLVKDEDLVAADVMAHLAVVTVEAAILNEESLNEWNVRVFFVKVFCTHHWQTLEGEASVCQLATTETVFGQVPLNSQVVVDGICQGSQRLSRFLLCGHRKADEWCRRLCLIVAHWASTGKLL